MKRLIYTILLSLVICSCGSHKSNLKQETSINVESNHQRKDTASFREQVKKAEREDVTETVEEVTTVYDTNQPVDSDTGKHPVLSETKKTIKREINKGSQEDKSKSLNQSVVVNDNIKAVVQERNEEDKQKDETTVPRQIGGIIWALAVLVVVIIVGWMIYISRKK